MDKLHYMKDYLQEDNEATQQQLKNAETIRDQSRQDMEQIEMENT